MFTAAGPHAGAVPKQPLDVPGYLAALRELKEETGLLGEIVRKAGESSFLSEYRGQETKNWQENFLVRPLTCLLYTSPSPRD